MTHRIALRLATFTLLLTVIACGSTPGGSEQTGTSESALVTATGVDYSWARPSPSGLKAGGYTFAVRYLSYDTTGKNLSKSEATGLWAAGVDVVANWENSGTAALNGYAQGASDAKAADSEAAAYGIPAGRPIYFSIDFDAQSSEQGALDAYFDGVASVIGLARTGAYGGYGPIGRLFTNKKITWGWQTYAWSYGQWDSRAQLRQVQNGITAAGDANCCDEDQAVAADYGQWHAAPPENPPKGYLDSADCTAIAGWSQDPDSAATAIDVDLYFNGAAGAAGTEAMRVLAGDNRTDLCKPLGSCNHGFSIPVPVGLLDDKSHSVYAYGIDAQGGPNTLLTGSAMKIQCANAKPPLAVPAGVKRHVSDGASMTAWSFSMLHDVAPEPDSLIASYPESTAFPEKPALVQADDGSPEVWVLDSEVKRHVISPTSLAAWHRTAAEVVKTPAAKVKAIAQGPDLPEKPFLMIGSGPAIYVLDVAPQTPPAPPNESDGGTTPPNHDSGSGGGCSVSAPSPAGSSWLLALGLPVVLIARRRDRTLRAR